MLEEAVARTAQLQERMRQQGIGFDYPTDHPRQLLATET